MYPIGYGQTDQPTTPRTVIDGHSSRAVPLAEELAGGRVRGVSDGWDEFMQITLLNKSIQFFQGSGTCEFRERDEYGVCVGVCALGQKRDLQVMGFMGTCHM